MWQELIIGSAGASFPSEGMDIDDGFTLYHNGKLGKGVTALSPIATSQAASSSTAAYGYQVNGQTAGSSTLSDVTGVCVKFLSGSNLIAYIPFSVPSGTFIANKTMLVFHVGYVNLSASTTNYPVFFVGSALPTAVTTIPSTINYVELPNYSTIGASSTSNYRTLVNGTWCSVLLTQVANNTPHYFGIGARQSATTLFVDYIGYVNT